MCSCNSEDNLYIIGRASHFDIYTVPASQNLGVYCFILLDTSD